MQAIGTLLVGFAAIAALLFTWQSTRATNGQLQVTEQGQITDRYNAAITNLGSTSVDVRLGGIYALQRIMQDSVRDQSTVVAVLCAFVRDHSTAATSSTAGHPPTDIQAALTVVATRDPTRDTPATVVDLTNAYLFGAYLSDAKFADAHLRGVNLVRAYMPRANLTGADLLGVVLARAYMPRAHLAGAHLAGAHLSGAHLSGAHLSGAYLSGADLTGATLTGADFTGVHLTSAVLTCVKGLPPNLCVPRISSTALTSRVALLAVRP
jgi:hypothetical protein